MATTNYLLGEVFFPDGSQLYNGFVHGFVFRRADLTEMTEWCADRFGQSGPEAAWDLEVAVSTIWLREPDHAMEFKLRWL